MPDSTVVTALAPTGRQRPFTPRRLPLEENVFLSHAGNRQAARGGSSAAGPRNPRKRNEAMPGKSLAWVMPARCPPIGRTPTAGRTSSASTGKSRGGTACRATERARGPPDAFRSSPSWLAPPVAQIWPTNWPYTSALGRSQNRAVSCCPFSEKVFPFCLAGVNTPRRRTRDPQDTRSEFQEARWSPPDLSPRPRASGD